VAVPAALAILAEQSISILFWSVRVCAGAVGAQQGQAYAARLKIRHASQLVEMDERPQEAMRKKKGLFDACGLDLVKAGEAEACVSAGNTGALMATARFVLKTIPGIDRPAILGRIPAHHGHTHMLDLGANRLHAENLFQFAMMVRWLRPICTASSAHA